MRNSLGQQKSDEYFSNPPPQKKNIKNTLLRWTFQGFASSFSLGYRKEVLWEPFNDGQQMLWEELKKLLKPNEKTTSLRCVPCRSRDLEPCSFLARCKRGMSCLRVVEVVVVRFFWLSKLGGFQDVKIRKKGDSYRQSLNHQLANHQLANHQIIWLIVCGKILSRGFDTPETRLF